MRLNTFGRVHIARDGGEEVALQPLPLAVLVYLVVGGPRDRDHLADLFWHNSKNGLNSLSTTLNRIRAEVPGGIWVEGNSLVGTDLASDVADLHDAIDRSDPATVSELYGAPFLGGLKLRQKSVEFEEWMLEQRSSLASAVELALLQQGRELHAAGEYGAAATAVEQAWDVAIRDGFPSPDYFETYHRILASAASPAASAVRTMADELGIVLQPVEPVTSRSRSEDGTPDGESLSLGHPIASRTSPLFGCQDELQAIVASVAASQLTTVVGLGGSGKTRLAAEFFDRPDTEQDFPHRCWVNLGDVVDHDLVGPAIAAALGQRFDSPAGLVERLPVDEPFLLAVDNFEHVMESAPVIEELARAHENVHVLVTSRVPLAVAGEALVQLSGLDTAADHSESPAEQLFVASARRAGVSDDRLDGQSREQIRDVCRRVGGNPLALEIAGGWAQLLSPAQILDALALDNELLGTPMVGDLRSMDAVLDYSWSTLGDVDQNALMLLATFPGGCLTNEALQLSELSVSSIGRLAQNSLVRLQVEGRISLHPLIARRALSELERRPAQHRRFQQVLSSWCQSFAESWSEPGAGSQAFDAEIANFVNAWTWDAEQGLWEMHRSTLAPLRQFFNEAGRVSEGRALFAAVATALQAAASPPKDLLPAVLEALGWLEFLSGDVAQARKRFDAALALTTSDEPATHVQTLRSLGVLQLNAGEIDEASASFEAGLAIIGDRPSALAASLQYDLAQAHLYRGDRDQAVSSARLALQAGRSTNDLAVMARCYLLLADIEAELNPERAIVLLNEGWAIAKDASLDNLAIYFPSILGLAHLSLRDAQLAEECFTQGIEAATEVGQMATVCGNHIGRAEAHLLRGQVSDAVDDLMAGIRLARKTDSGRYLMWAAVVSCRAAAVVEKPHLQAKELLLLVLRQPATDQHARDMAVESLRELFDITPDEDPALIEGPGEDRDSGTDLDEIAERSLQLLAMPGRSRN